MATECRPVDKFHVLARARDVRVIRSVSLIEAGLKDPRLAVAGLAAKLHISSSRLRQLFAAELGIGPKTYIHQLRLIRAQNLLGHSSLSIKEVMAAVGFNDPSHFSRDFKKHFGVSPAVYRERRQATVDTAEPS